MKRQEGLPPACVSARESAGGALHRVCVCVEWLSLRTWHLHSNYMCMLIALGFLRACCRRMSLPLAALLVVVDRLVGMCALLQCGLLHPIGAQLLESVLHAMFARLDVDVEAVRAADGVGAAPRTHAGHRLEDDRERLLSESSTNTIHSHEHHQRSAHHAGKTDACSTHECADCLAHMAASLHGAALTAPSSVRSVTGASPLPSGELSD
jgi:hypothetical protein